MKETVRLRAVSFVLRAVVERSYFPILRSSLCPARRLKLSAPQRIAGGAKVGGSSFGARTGGLLFVPRFAVQRKCHVREASFSGEATCAVQPSGTPFPWIQRANLNKLQRDTTFCPFHGSGVERAVSAPSRDGESEHRLKNSLLPPLHLLQRSCRIQTKGQQGNLRLLGRALGNTTLYNTSGAGSLRYLVGRECRWTIRL